MVLVAPPPTRRTGPVPGHRRAAPRSARLRRPLRCIALTAVLLVAGLLGACATPTASARFPTTRASGGSGCASDEASVAPLRGRTTVDDADRRVTATAPADQCDLLRVYTVQFVLTTPDRAWQQPVYVGTLTAGRSIDATLPPAEGVCTAAAVMAVPDDVTLDDAAAAVLADLETWPDAATVLVPTSAQLAGGDSYLLAAQARGRPAGCRDGTTSLPAPGSSAPGSSAPAVVAPPGACAYGAVGAALRPTVKVSGATVTVSPGALGCDVGVSVLVADYTLTSDPADEPAATTAGVLVPGGSPVTLTFPSSFAQCRATAVYFEIGTDAATTDAAFLQIRQEIARWPASARAVAPDRAYVARYPRTRLLLARNISGLGACAHRDSERVTTPAGKVRACWSEGPDSQPGRPEYVEVACSAEHVYEVYHVEALTWDTWFAAGAKGEPDAWAKARAQRTCRTKQSGIRLSGAYRTSSLGTTYVWTTGLSAVPGALPGTDTWEGAQIVCLIHRSDNSPVTRRILR